MKEKQNYPKPIETYWILVICFHTTFSTAEVFYICLFVFRRQFIVHQHCWLNKPTQMKQMKKKIYNFTNKIDLCNFKLANTVCKGMSHTHAYSSKLEHTAYQRPHSAHVTHSYTPRQWYVRTKKTYKLYFFAGHAYTPKHIICINGSWLTKRMKADIIRYTTTITIVRYRYVHTRTHSVTHTTRIRALFVR